MLNVVCYAFILDYNSLKETLISSELFLLFVFKKWGGEISFRCIGKNGYNSFALS